MKKTFISHSSEDKLFVKKFKEDLNYNGIDTFFDQDEIKAGDDIKAVLSVGLEEATHFIIVLSENSVNSEWVQFELRSVLSQDNTMKSKIIPIIYRECEIPKDIKSLKYIKVNNVVISKNGDHVLIAGGQTEYNYMLTEVVQLINSKNQLNKSDKVDLLNSISLDSNLEYHEIKDELIVNTVVKHKIAKYKDRTTLAYYIRDMRHKTKKNKKYKPIILPPIYAQILNEIRVGDELHFINKDTGASEICHFSMFRKTDIGITMQYSVRQNLGLMSGKDYVFRVNLDKLIFEISNT
jgi:TIR domain